MKKMGMRIISVVALVLLASAWLHDRELKAEPQAGYGQAACVSYIPRAWGEYRGGSQQSGLAFEDANGTLRFVTNVPCEGTPLVALELRRTPASPSTGN